MMRATKVSLNTWAIALVQALFFVVAASVDAAQDEPRVGSWELNLAKSTFSPGPAPKKQTLTFRQAPIAVFQCVTNRSARAGSPRHQLPGRSGGTPLIRFHPPSLERDVPAQSAPSKFCLVHRFTAEAS